MLRSPADQKESREKFGEPASKTRGLTGVELLADGRVLSKSAIVLGEQLRSSKIELPPTTEFEEGTKQTEPCEPVGISYYPGKTPIKPVPEDNSTRSFLKDLHDIIEALRIAKMVENGQMPRELGMLLLLEKI